MIGLGPPSRTSTVKAAPFATRWLMTPVAIAIANRWRGRGSSPARNGASMSIWL